MDMNVKLSLSYPAVAALGNPGGKTWRLRLPASDREGPRNLSEPELENAVKNIQDFVQSTQRQLDFSIDDSTGLVVVKVIATDSGELDSAASIGSCIESWRRV